MAAKLHVEQPLQGPQGPAAPEQQQQQQQQAAQEAVQGADGSDSGARFLPCATFQGPKPGFAFKRGDKGIGYYADQGQQVRGCGGAAGDKGGAAGRGLEGEGGARQGEAAAQQGKRMAGHVHEGGRAREGGATQGCGAAQEGQMCSTLEEEAALRQAEAALDAEAAERLGRGRFKLVPVLGTPFAVGGGPAEFGKHLSGKAKVCGVCLCVFAGLRVGFV